MDIDLGRWSGPAVGALRAASLAAVGGCVGLWVRAKTVHDDERGNAERRALFVGLWPALLWSAADTIAAAARRR